MKVKPLVRIQLSSIKAGNKVTWEEANNAALHFLLWKQLFFIKSVLSVLRNGFITYLN